MPRKSPEKYWLDMVLAGQRIRRFLTGYDKQSFAGDEKTISAVERQFEILGEAARQVDQATRQNFHRSIFRKSSECGILSLGMRNLVSHDYRHVRVDVLWDRSQNYLPPSIATLEPYLARLCEREQEREPPGFER